MSYTNFENLKKQKNLSLSKVNELHSDIKKFIYSDMTNVVRLPDINNLLFGLSLPKLLSSLISPILSINCLQKTEPIKLTKKTLQPLEMVGTECKHKKQDIQD